MAANITKEQLSKYFTEGKAVPGYHYIKRNFECMYRDVTGLYEVFEVYASPDGTQVLYDSNAHQITVTGVYQVHAELELSYGSPSVEFYEIVRTRVE